MKSRNMLISSFGEDAPKIHKRYSERAAETSNNSVMVVVQRNLC